MILSQTFLCLKVSKLFSAAVSFVPVAPAVLSGPLGSRPKLPHGVQIFTSHARLHSPGQGLGVTPAKTRTERSAQASGSMKADGLFLDDLWMSVMSFANNSSMTMLEGADACLHCPTLP